MKETDRPFGEWLAASMQTRNLSQAEVARQLGVADAQVSRWRRGHVVPSRQHVRKIAAAFHVPTERVEQLAGYAPPGADAAGAPDIDPVMKAEEEAILHTLAEVLEHKVPHALWSAYVKGCETLAAELVRAFEHAVEASQAQPTHAIGFLARVSDDAGTKRPTC
ncbi:MAG: helix-turn-helix domain-containing protein [Chloroflexota bacterium]|nr:helix-turn-helix domain-containing protein [Chloroflexota bacterium]